MLHWKKSVSALHVGLINFCWIFGTLELEINPEVAIHLKGAEVSQKAAQPSHLADSNRSSNAIGEASTLKRAQPEPVSLSSVYNNPESSLFSSRLANDWVPAFESSDFCDLVFDLDQSNLEFLHPACGHVGQHNIDAHMPIGGYHDQTLASNALHSESASKQLTGNLSHTQGEDLTKGFAFDHDVERLLSKDTVEWQTGDPLSESGEQIHNRELKDGRAYTPNRDLCPDQRQATRCIQTAGLETYTQTGTLPMQDQWDEWINRDLIQTSFSHPVDTQTTQKSVMLPFDDVDQNPVMLPSDDGSLRMRPWLWGVKADSHHEKLPPRYIRLDEQESPNALGFLEPQVKNHARTETDSKLQNCSLKIQTEEFILLGDCMKVYAWIGSMFEARRAEASIKTVMATKFLSTIERAQKIYMDEYNKYSSIMPQQGGSFQKKRKTKVLDLHTENQEGNCQLGFFHQQTNMLRDKMEVLLKHLWDLNHSFLASLGGQDNNLHYYMEQDCLVKWLLEKLLNEQIIFSIISQFSNDYNYHCQDHQTLELLMFKYLNVVTKSNYFSIRVRNSRNRMDISEEDAVRTQLVIYIIGLYYKQTNITKWQLWFKADTEYLGNLVMIRNQFYYSTHNTFFHRRFESYRYTHMLPWIDEITEDKMLTVTKTMNKLQFKRSCEFSIEKIQSMVIEGSKRKH